MEKQDKVYFLPNPTKLKKVGMQAIYKLGEVFPIKGMPTIVIRRHHANNSFIIGIVDETGKIESEIAKLKAKNEQKQTENK